MASSHPLSNLKSKRESKSPLAWYCNECCEKFANEKEKTEHKTCYALLAKQPSFVPVKKEPFKIKTERVSIFPMVKTLVCLYCNKMYSRQSDLSDQYVSV